MPQLRLSGRAQSDLSRLHAFLGSKDGNAARRALLAIRDAFTPLTHAPLIGRPVEDSEDLRELVIDFGDSGYIALYRYVGDAVTVLSFQHQKEAGYLSD